jgi:protein tyrosine/serine phosphatase
VVDDSLVRDYAFSRVFNFRDVGGLAGMDGRTVRWRRLFRSDSLHGLCTDDRDAFTALGIRTVLDLRRPYEVERDGRIPEWDGIVWRHIHPDHREWSETPFQKGGDLSRYLADRYLDLSEDGASELAEAVALIADQNAAPMVVHCVAGKDRTGVVCALALSLLGVSDMDIAADYALSAVGFERYKARMRKELPDETSPSPQWYRSPTEAMMLFLPDLRKRHGSVGEYLIGAGLAPERIDALRAHLLTPAG